MLWIPVVGWVLAPIAFLVAVFFWLSALSRSPDDNDLHFEIRERFGEYARDTRNLLGMLTGSSANPPVRIC